MMYEENIDYELVPSSNDEDHWNVRILTGDYVESVVAFGHIELKDSIGDQSSQMSFNFDLIFSPDSELTVEQIEFQSYAGDLLMSIIESSLEANSVHIKERGSDGNNSTK